MEATAISGPACVYRQASDSRGMDEPLVLQIAITFAPCSRAWRTAMSVSMVSPDWDRATTRVFSFTMGSRYRNSWANSTSVGIRHQCSIAYRATMPA